jgi:hypothetical protein
MTPERRKYAVTEAPRKTSIAGQRLARHVSAAMDRLVETKAYNFLCRVLHIFKIFFSAAKPDRRLLLL